MTPLFRMPQRKIHVCLLIKLTIKKDIIYILLKEMSFMLISQYKNDTNKNANTRTTQTKINLSIRQKCVNKIYVRLFCISLGNRLALRLSVIASTLYFTMYSHLQPIVFGLIHILSPVICAIF